MPEEFIIDLQDRIDELETELEEVERTLEDLRSEAAELKAEYGLGPDAVSAEQLQAATPGDSSDDGAGEGDGDDEQSPLDRAVEVETSYQALDEYRKEIETDLETIRSRIDEWDGSHFTASQLTWADRNHVDDLVAAETIRDGLDDTRAKQGAYKMKFVSVALDKKPPGCPDPGGLPPCIGDYLFDRIDAFCSRGETNLSTSSVWETV